MSGRRQVRAHSEGGCGAAEEAGAGELEHETAWHLLTHGGSIKAQGNRQPGRGGRAEQV